VPYVTVSPGPTLDVLGEQNGEPIVRVTGHRTYPVEGQFRLTTVSVTNPERKVTLVEAIAGWVDDDIAVLPYEAMYPERNTAEEERTQSQALMVSSQDTAVAAALGALGYDLPSYAVVTGVSGGGPSDGKLKARDRIVALGEREITDVDGVFAAIKEYQPGDSVPVTVRRGEAERRFVVETVAAEDDPKRPLIGVLVGTGYDFPFDVELALDDSIGGPSAGLVFALSVYDTLTPGSLTGGDVIAGTGSITPDGAVGPIGGVRQKIAAAEEAGAEVFLVPRDNCASAVHDPVEGIELIRADDLAGAIKALETYSEDPSADLPRCPA
jgi:Lon-like protease